MLEKGSPEGLVVVFSRSALAMFFVTVTLKLSHINFSCCSHSSPVDGATLEEQQPPWETSDFM